MHPRQGGFGCSLRFERYLRGDFRRTHGNARFFSLDLTNTCWTRSFYSSEGTVLVLWQVNDLELEHAEPVLKAICSSFRVEMD